MAFSCSELNFALTSLVPWEIFATYLPGITQADIEKIQTDEPKNAKQKIALFSKWLKVFPSAKWSDVVRALKKAREIRLAEEIESKYVTMDIFVTTSGVGSFKHEIPEDDSYAYPSPENETQEKIQGSVLHVPSSGQQETLPLKQNSTQHWYISPEKQKLKIERVHHLETTNHKQRLLKEREELQAEVDELKNINIVAQCREQCHKLDMEKQNQNYQQELEKANKLLKDEQQIHQQELDTLATNNEQQDIKIQNISIEYNRLADTNGSLISELNELKKTNSEAIRKIDKLEQELTKGNLRFENTKLMMIKVAKLMIRNVASLIILFVSVMIKWVIWLMGCLFWLIAFLIAVSPLIFIISIIIMLIARLTSTT